MNGIHTLDNWHKTASGHFIFGLAELGIAYGFASLSIDRGNLVWYALTLLFFIGAIRNLFNVIGAVISGKRKSSKA